MNLATVLPLAIVMVSGPQIISAVFLATSQNWRRNSTAFLAGAALSITLFVTIAYLVTKQLKSSAGSSQRGASGHVIDIVVLVLLLILSIYVFRGREKTEPPKWMGRLQTASPRFCFILGFLLLGIFPTDILTSTTVGARLARQSAPWLDAIPFVLLTLLLLALPVLVVLLLGRRGEVFLPKARDWMSANSWIISEIVVLFFVAVTINSLVS